MPIRQRTRHLTAIRIPIGRRAVGGRPDKDTTTPGLQWILAPILPLTKFVFLSLAAGQRDIALSIGTAKPGRPLMRARLWPTSRISGLFHLPRSRDLKVRTVFTSGTDSSPAICEFEVYFDNRVLDGVVSEWHLDNNLKDDVGGNDGVLKGNVVYGPGKTGQAIQLDGNLSYVEIPDSDSLDKDLNSMALSAWVKINSFPVQGYAPVVKERSYRFFIDPSGYVGFVVATKNNAWYSPGTGTNCSTRLSIGKWYHLVGTYDGSFMNCYINGTKEGTGPQPISGSIADESNPLYFGYKSADNIDWLDGMIDEVRLYRRALDDTEVRDAYYSNPDKLVSEWHLDNNLNDDMFDNHGVLKGNAVYGPGKIGQAIQLDGNNSYGEVPDSDSLDSNLKTMTLSAWVKINSFPGSDKEYKEYAPVDKGGSYHFAIGPWGHVAFDVGTKNYALGSLGTIATNATPQLSRGNWCHLVGTYDGSFANLYVNGTKEGTGPQAISGSIADNPNPFYFNWMDGMVDEVRIYNRALSDDEVKALYDSYK